MELTHTDVDVDALLLDGKQRLQAWNEKYSERNPAADAEVRVAEPVPQVMEYDFVIKAAYTWLNYTITARNSLFYCVCMKPYGYHLG